ncbi:MAG: hypothetical protein V4858_03130 [Pseudomonadota bacterium]
MVWCPYTGVETDIAACNKEHIIPLSLGGSNGFTLPVDAAINARLGSEVDAALSDKDLLTMFRRREFDARGHSKIAPTVKVRNATYGPDSRPAQVTLRGKEGLTIWDARDRSEVPEENLPGTQMELKFIIDPYARMRFTAKVALAAGYEIYGELFRETADHASVRALMQAASFDDAKKTFSSLNMRGLFEHMPVADDQVHYVQMEKTACAAVAGSVVLARPMQDSVAFTVGILGQWVGMLNVPADTERYPYEGLHDLGHAVLLIDGKTERQPYREFVRRLLETMTGAPVPMPPGIGESA